MDRCCALGMKPITIDSKDQQTCLGTMVKGQTLYPGLLNRSDLLKRSLVWYFELLDVRQPRRVSGWVSVHLVLQQRRGVQRRRVGCRTAGQQGRKAVVRPLEGRFQGRHHHPHRQKLHRHVPHGLRGRKTHFISDIHKQLRSFPRIYLSLCTTIPWRVS